MRRPLTLLAFASLALVACAGPAPIASGTGAAPAPATAEADTAAAQFDAAVDALAKGYFRAVPEGATYNGVPDALAPGAGARLNDRSPAGEASRTAEMETLLAALKAVPTAALDENRRRVQATLVTVLDGALAPGRLVDYGTSFGAYGLWFLPYAVNQISGPTLDVPNLLGSQHSVTDVAQARAYLARLEAFPDILDGTLETLRHDVAAGVIPPDFVIDKSRAVIAAFVGKPAADHALVASFRARLGAAKVDGADDFAEQAEALVADGVLPAYRRIDAYLARIRPQAPHDAGIWRLPNGDALYRAMIRQMTDEDRDPAEVHRIGLAEVERIGAEMDALLRAQGYTEGTTGERMQKLGLEQRFLYANDDTGRAAIMADIQSQLAGVRAVLPRWFGTLPKHEVEVRRVPAFSEASAPGGYYDPPSPDGSRPGVYSINLGNPAAMPRFALPTLTYHEAIPGHHLQMAIAIDQDIPPIANALYSNPSGEGWALYTEALAKEMGLYDADPFGDLGRLQAEMHRAVRLVVDTGMHAMKWSREQAVDYMMEHEGAERGFVEAEIERYAVWPGQALGYKLGMLKLQALRAEAEAALGDRFDIRGFHDRVLRVSSFALPVIEADVRAWISSGTTPTGSR